MNLTKVLSQLLSGFHTFTWAWLLVFFVGTPSEWQNLVQGLAILLALMIGVLVGRRAKS